MCYSFDRIFDRMSKIVHWIDTPFISGIVMCHMCHTVNNRITHVDVRRCHIDLCTQDFFAVRIFTVFHCLKQFQVFFNAAVTVWAFFTRLCQCSPILTDLLCCQIADICLAFSDQFHSSLIHLVKVIGCKEQPVLPVSAQPLDICFDGLYKLCSFFCRVRIIKTHIEPAVIFLCQSVV